MTIRRTSGVMIFFGLVAFLALYRPLLASGTYIPGSKMTDYFHFHWVYWWANKALADPDLRVFYTDYVMFPYENNLAYHTMSLSYYPVWLLLTQFSNTLAAMNGIFWLTLTLTGFFTFLLLRREGIALPIALLGAVAVECSPLAIRAVWYTNPNLLGTFWYPVALLVWGVVAGAVQQRAYWRAIGWAILMGLCFWGMILTDLQYGMFMPFLLIPYGGYTLWRMWGASELGAHSRAPLQNTMILLVMGGIALMVGLVFSWFLGYLPALVDYDQTDVLRSHIEDTWGMYFPSGYLWNAPDYYIHPRIGGVIPALFLLALGVLLWKRRIATVHRWNLNPSPLFWLVVAFLPLILSVGREITLFGQSIPMPYRAYHQLAGGLFRFPERFGTLFLMPALLFAGLILSPYVKRSWYRWGTVVGLLLVLVNLRTLYPMDIQKPIPIYNFYRQMGEDEETYLVVEVPTGAGSGVHLVGDAEVQIYEYYGIIHGKKMINGHISRIQTSHWWWLRTDDPLLSWLGQRRYLDRELVEAELAQIIPNYPLGYIVVHQDAVRGNDPSTNEEIIGYLNSLPQFFCPPVVEGPAVAFRSTWHPDGCSTTRTPPQPDPNSYLVDIGAVGDEVFLGDGWHYREQIAGLSLRWSGRNEQTFLYLDVPQGDYTLRLSAQAYWEPRQLAVLANGLPLGAAQPVSTETLQELTFTIPAEAFTNGEHLTLTIVYDDRIQPSAVVGSGDERPLALMVDWVRLER